MSICGCVEDSTFDLIDQLKLSESFDDFLAVCNNNYGIASILYYMIKYYDVFAQERKNYTTFLSTFAWLGQYYTDKISVFNLLIQEDNKITQTLPYDKLSRPVAYLVLSYMEHLGLMDHGSNIQGSWLRARNMGNSEYIDIELAERMIKDLNKYTSGYTQLDLSPYSQCDSQWIVDHTPSESKDDLFWKKIYDHEEIGNRIPAVSNNIPTDLKISSTDSKISSTDLNTLVQYIYLDPETETKTETEAFKEYIIEEINIH